MWCVVREYPRPRSAVAGARREADHGGLELVDAADARAWADQADGYVAARASAERAAAEEACGGVSDHMVRNTLREPQPYSGLSG